MKVLALHGFLGEGTDWHPLMDALSPQLEWIMPSLFSPKSEVNLESYDAFSTSIQQMDIKGPKILIGYSMGGRLAYELFKKQPDEWDALVVLSAHPGLETSEEAEQRAEQVQVWKDRLLNWNWKELLSAWNSQAVLRNSQPLQLTEERFDRERMCLGLENLSVDKQKFDPQPLKRDRSKIWAYVGSEDKKYVDIYSRLENRGIIENLTILEGLGHRILHDGLQELATRLEADLDL